MSKFQWLVSIRLLGLFGQIKRHSRFRESIPFPNPKSIKRPDYLPPITNREEKEQWEADVLTRYKMLTENLLVGDVLKVSPYNKAMGGLNQKSIPRADWENIVEHSLWVACYTYDRDKRKNIERYNLTAKKPKRIPSKVCPLPNYFWRILHFTSCTWWKKYATIQSNTLELK